MSYQVLARQYRPRNFSTLVGQEHVVKALTHALDQQRLHHAYMFTGTRGVGKTTLSRILAKALNCTGPDGAGDITSTPCGVCEACVAIDAGRFVDYIEMDAASNRGVDEMAQLLEQAAYAPNNARFKVYMIDEVHMLTNHAFNAMLKTLEEPPPYVKFILATTDPQKIPVTVLSRCLQFNLKQMPPQHIVSHLENILAQEQIPFEPGALRLLAKGAQGSMRDALSLTDQAIAYAAGNVSLDAVQGMLGALDQSFLISILDALAQQDGQRLLAVAADMSTRSLSFSAALQDLATLLHQLAIAQTVPQALDASLPDTAELIRLAALIQPEDVQLYYQIAVHGRQELSLAPDEQAGFSMTLLRMLSFAPGDALASSGSSGGGQVRAAAPVARPAPVTPSTTSRAYSAASTDAQDVDNPLLVKKVAEPDPPLYNAAVQPVASPVVEAPPAQSKVSPARAALEAARQGSLNRAAGASRSAAPQHGAPSASVQPAAAALPAYAQGSYVTGPSISPSTAGQNGAPEQIIVPVTAQPSATSPGYAAAPALATVHVPPVMPETAFARHQDEAREGRYVADEREAPDFGGHYFNEYEVDDSTQASDPDRGERSGAMISSAVSAPEAAQAVLSVLPTAAGPAVFDQVDGWNGDWPALVATLTLRGVVHQLAQQSELAGVRNEPDLLTLRLNVPLPTLRSAGSPEKLTAALVERFGRALVLDIVIAPARDTAQVRADAKSAAALAQAESDLLADTFVHGMMKEFGASIVPGTIRHGG